MSGYAPQRYGMGGSMFPSFAGSDMFGLDFGSGRPDPMGGATTMSLGGITGPSAVDGLASMGPLAPKMTGMTGSGGLFSGMTGLDKAQLGIAGLGTIGNLWSAFQAQKLAKQQFKFTKNVTNTNLENQLKTFNTALTDRANNRAIVEGRTPDETQKYIDANSLRRYGK